MHFEEQLLFEDFGVSKVSALASAESGLCDDGLRTGSERLGMQANVSDLGRSCEGPGTCTAMPLCGW